jgi:hypothetical protein
MYEPAMKDSNIRPVRLPGANNGFVDPNNQLPYLPPPMPIQSGTGLPQQMAQTAERMRRIKIPSYRANETAYMNPALYQDGFKEI